MTILVLTALTALVTGASNVSEFTEVDILPVQLELDHVTASKTLPAKQVNIVTFDEEFFLDWHTTEVKRLVAVLEGEFGIVLRDGSTKVFKTGDLILADDLVGTGHQARGIQAGRLLVIDLE